MDTSFEAYKKIKPLYQGHVVLVREGHQARAYNGDAETVAGAAGSLRVGHTVNGEFVTETAVSTPDSQALSDLLGKLVAAGHLVALVERTGRDGPWVALGDELGLDDPDGEEEDLRYEGLDYEYWEG